MRCLNVKFRPSKSSRKMAEIELSETEKKYLKQALEVYKKSLESYEKALKLSEKQEDASETRKLLTKIGDIQSEIASIARRVGTNGSGDPGGP